MNARNAFSPPKKTLQSGVLKSEDGDLQIQIRTERAASAVFFP